MDSSLHEDDSLQSSWPTGLGINLVSMDHDGDLTANDAALVILHDRLITDASDDAPAKSNLFGGESVEIRSVRANATPETPKDANNKDKPISVTTTTVAKDTVVPAVSKITHFINGNDSFVFIIEFDQLEQKLPCPRCLETSNKAQNISMEDL